MSGCKLSIHSLLLNYLLLFPFVLVAQSGVDLWRQISLGIPIVENGIRLVDTHDSRRQATQLGGYSCIEMLANKATHSAYLYFSIDDSYIYNDSRDVFITIEYFNRGSGLFYLQYDAAANPYVDAGSKHFTATNTWEKHTFVLPLVGLSNGQNGGADFRLAVFDTTRPLPAFKQIWIWRAPGNYIAPRAGDFSGETFTSKDDLVFSYYFYWYDVYSGAHIWDNGAQTDDALQDHPASMVDFSYKSAAWHKRELQDIMAAGIDVILPVYWGSSREMENWSVEGLRKLVQAEQELLNEGIKPPKIGLFFDTSTLFYGETVLKSGDGPTDLSTPFGMAFFYKQVRDFYSLIPPSLWARIDNKPVVWLYAAGFSLNAGQALINYVNDRFSASFAGMQPYIVAEVSWNLNVQNKYAWGAALNGAQLLGVASVGPGYNDSAVPGRSTPVRSRENGDFYRRNWNTVLGSGRNFVVVETWNELHEGTDICDSREYGRSFIEMTAEYSRIFKQPTKFSGFQPQGWVNTPHPNCSVQVRDRQYGIRPATVNCRYTDDGGATWHDWPATCTGSAGAMEMQTIHAVAIPFNANATPLSTPNFVQFILTNGKGESTVSPTFPVNCGIAPAFSVENKLGQSAEGSGLQQRYRRNDDGWCAETHVAGEFCVYNLVKNNSPYPGRYLYFDVADSLVLAGSSPEIWLTINYYDTSATANMELQYDSPGAAIANMYKSGGSVSIANSRKWKSKTYHLSDAWFANRENGGSDFRIYSSGVMFISRVSVSNQATTRVNPESGEPALMKQTRFGLEQNYPNPFNQSTMISYSLDQSKEVTLMVFDVAGKQVCVLAKGQQEAGTHYCRWDGKSDMGPVASGLYFLRLLAGDEESISRILLLR